MTQDRNLTDMEDGHTAGIIHGLFEDFLQEQVRLLVSQIITLYRNGQTHHDKLVGLAAELTCLDRIVNELRVKQQRGIAAREKEFNNAPPVQTSPRRR